MSRIEQQNLVLHPSPHVDPAKWDEAKYYNFVDELCCGREYQKTAIFAALRFLLGGNYADLRALARENFKDNDKLREYHGSWNAFESRLQLPDILSCSLDLATGTGKSYVLYGLAAIMLAEGVAKRVLVLCPSLTIETGLTGKFRELAGNNNLLALMPDSAKFSPPRIIDASQTVEEGCICIENYHAVLKHVKSSIRDSFAGCGGDTLVLNDEAHHVASESAANLGKWKGFLTDPGFGFHRVVGVSGTCYVGNEYFCDVVSRYSLREAIEERVVKNVEYVAEAKHFREPDERWQPIYQNHKRNARNLRSRGIRPLSIVVTQRISGCENVAEELREFLCKTEKISADEAAQKVLVVTSAKQHRHNVPQLQNVDNPQSKTEWIISVSMLSEGWDVKNVFQVVPHEERAFNSKLLIAQVLGRGLRIPEQWSDTQPIVTVYNHEAWSARIKSLVYEVLEIEQRVSSVVIPESKWHFDLHHLEYDRNSDEKSYSMKKEYNLFEAGYVALPAAAVTLDEPTTTRYVRVHGNERTQTGAVRRNSHSIRDVAKHMWNHLSALDKESEGNSGQKKTRYAERYPLSLLLDIVRKSVAQATTSAHEITDETGITNEGRQQMLAALNVVRRGASKRVTYSTRPTKMHTFNTRDRQAGSCSVAELRRNKAVFHRPDCADYLPQEQKDVFARLADQDGEFSGNVILVENTFHFKSPVNLAIASHTPERRFILGLMKPENAGKIAGWLKNSDAGFYAIEYAWGAGHRPGRTSHTRLGQFSPDFFVKMCDGRVFVVEIKDNSEIKNLSRENIGKFRFASDHFRTLNEWLKEKNVAVHYQFNMLTPQDYDLFFASWNDRYPEKYKSNIDAAMEMCKADNGNGDGVK